MKVDEIISEAPLSPIQLRKRDNWEVFKRKIRDGEEFTLSTNPEETVLLGHTDAEEHEAFLELLDSGKMEEVLEHFREGSSILLPVIGGDPVRLTHLQKTKEFGRRGGKVETERQEHSFVEYINEAVLANKNKPITVKTKGATVNNVKAANKVEGISSVGREPYADIAIHTADGKQHLISAKGTTAPSIAGGGLLGLMNINPNIVGDALERALEFYKEKFPDDEGKQFPLGKSIEVYVKIPDKYLEDILRGTEEMGGPIDYMYIGPLDVDAEAKNGTLTLSGKLIEINDYMEAVGSLYLRIRRRRETQVLDYTSRDKFGFPNIFYQQGEGGRRIVIVADKDLPKSLRKKGKDFYVGIGK